MFSEEQLREIREQHPDEWEAKKEAGLDPQTIATAIISQVEHDAKKPPHRDLISRAKGTIARATAAVALALALILEAGNHRAEAIEATPQEERADAEVEIGLVPPQPGTFSGRLVPASDFQTALVAATDRVTELEGLLSEINCTVDNQRTDLAGKDAEIITLKDRLEAKDAEITTLKQQLDTKDEEISALKDQLSAPKVGAKKK